MKENGTSPHRRILAVCGNNPRVVQSCLDLVTELKDRHGMGSCFVTTHPKTKLIFLKAGFSAFTIQELLEVASPMNRVSQETLEWLGGYDRIVDWRWVPEAGHRRDRDEAFEEYFLRQARWVLGAYHAVFEAVRPLVVLTWNGVALLQRAPVYLANRENVPCFFMERGLLPGTLVVDPQGVNYGSHIAGAGWAKACAREPSAEEKAALREFCDGLAEKAQTVVQHGESLSQPAIRQRLEIPEKSRVVLLPLQIEQDSNILDYSPHYKTMAEVIRGASDALEALEGVTLVVKPHPEDRDRLGELSSLSSTRVRLSGSLSLPSLLDLADAVVVVNSTVGLEACVRRKPVVMLGRGVYGEKGFTFDLRDPAELPTLMRQALEAGTSQQFNEDAFYRFLLYLLESCLFDLSEEDQWGSRKRIPAVIAEKAARTELPPRTSPRWMERLVEENAQISRLLRPLPESLSGKVPHVLLIGGAGWLEDLMASPVDGGPIVWQITRRNALRCALPSLVRHYDFAIAGRRVAGLRRLLWAMVRAKSKIRLV